MSFLTELIALVVVGDARYGRDYTPLDKLNDQANKGIDILEKTSQRNKQDDGG